MKIHNVHHALILQRTPISRSHQQLCVKHCFALLIRYLYDFSHYHGSKLCSIVEFVRKAPFAADQKPRSSSQKPVLPKSCISPFCRMVTSEYCSLSSLMLSDDSMQSRIISSSNCEILPLVEFMALESLTFDRNLAACKRMTSFIMNWSAQAWLLVSSWVLPFLVISSQFCLLNLVHVMVTPRLVRKDKGIKRYTADVVSCPVMTSLNW